MRKLSFIISFFAVVAYATTASAQFADASRQLEDMIAFLSTTPANTTSPQTKTTSTPALVYTSKATSSLQTSDSYLSDIAFLSNPTGKNQEAAAKQFISNIDFDDLLAGMDKKSSKVTAVAGVADEMAVGKTIDYVYDFFAKPSGYLTTYGPSGRKGHSPLLPGAATLPIRGIITSRYGYRPAFKRMHKGIDIALQVGDTIRAAMAGTVSRVDNDPHGYGLFMVVTHTGGFETRYAHLSGTIAAAGMSVMAGEPIALGGNTGNSTGPHLHFETRLNGNAVDPQSMFDFSHPGFMMAGRSNSITTGIDQTSPLASSGMDSSFLPSGKKGTTVSDRHTYVVKIGDTIASIAHATGITVMRLCNLNMLSATDPLTPGRMLKLR